MGLGSGSAPSLTFHSLREIYAHICSCCGHPKIACARNVLVPRIEDSIPLLSNRFDLLDVHCTKEQTGAEALLPPQTCTECSEGHLKPWATCRLSDDEICQAVEAAGSLARISYLKDSLVQCWQQTVEINVPVFLSACVTNYAFLLFRDIETQLAELVGTLELAEIRQKCHLLEHCNQTGHKEANQKLNKILHQLIESWDAVEHCINCPESNDLMGSFVKNPSQYIKCQSDVSTARTSSMRSVMEAIKQRGKLPEQPLTPISPSHLGYIPFVADMEQLLSDGNNSCSQIYGAFSLCSFYEIYDAYLHHLPQESAEHSAMISPSLAPNPRVAVLRYASSILSSLKSLLLSHPPESSSTFPCRCRETLAFHLEVLRIDLERFTQSRQWDLLHQSPWAVGCQMLDIIHRTTYYGQKLIRYRNFVGAVLHVYNALRTTGDLESIPILDGLCVELNGLIFPNGLIPQKNFSKTYVRFLGARLRFRRDGRGHDREDSWCMAIPSHAARESSGLNSGFTEQRPSTEASKGVNSLLLKFLRTDYRLDKNTLDDIHRNREPDDADLSTTTPRPKKKHSNNILDPIETISCLHRRLLTEWESPLHVAKLDFFTLYAACVRVVEQVSDSVHDERERHSISRCLCFVKTLLNGADRGGGWKEEEEKQVLEAFVGAVKDQFGTQAVESWTWGGGKMW